MQTSPAAPQTPPPPKKGWFARHWFWALPVGCLGMVLLCVAGLALVVYLFFGLLKDTPAAKEAILRAQQSERLQQELGTPIEPGWYISGSTKTSGKNIGFAELSVPLSGPKGKATLLLKASKNGAYWEFSRLQVEFEDGRRLDLLRNEMRPAPGGGPADRPAPKPGIEQVSRQL